MTLNLQNTINFALPFIQYSPVTAGLGQEPAVSIASMIRNTMLNQPITWPWNRNSTTFSTVVGQQDYTETITDLGFIEKVTLTDDQGNIIEIKDVLNNQSLAASTFQQQPSIMSVQSISGTSYTFRFIGVPDQIYTVT